MALPEGLTPEQIAQMVSDAMREARSRRTPLRIGNTVNVRVPHDWQSDFRLNGEMPVTERIVPLTYGVDFLRNATEIQNRRAEIWHAIGNPGRDDQRFIDNYVMGVDFATLGQDVTTIMPQNQENPVVRAERLLREALPEELYVNLCAIDRFEVTGKSGFGYEIAKKAKTIVTKLNKTRWSACIQLPSECPPADRVLAEYILIKSNEQEYLKTANLTQLGVPQSQSGAMLMYQQREAERFARRQYDEAYRQARVGPQTYEFRQLATHVFLYELIQLLGPEWFDGRRRRTDLPEEFLERVVVQVHFGNQANGRDGS